VHRYLLDVVSVCRPPQLSATFDEHVVRNRNGIPAVDGVVETCTHVARLCTVHSCLLCHLSLRSRHKGRLVVVDQYYKGEKGKN